MKKGKRNRTFKIERSTMYLCPSTLSRMLKNFFVGTGTLGMHKGCIALFETVTLFSHCSNKG